jgi:hypothetical protein
MARLMNTPHAMRHALLILSVVWVSCSGEHESEEIEVQSVEVASDTDPSFDAELDWASGQGNYVLGSFPDSLVTAGNYISASLVPENRTAFQLSVAGSNRGALLIADSTSGEHHEGTDTWFNGMTLTASNGGRITIRAVATAKPDQVRVEGVVPQPPSTLYALSYSAKLSDGSYAAPVDYCDNRGGAVVFAGVFDRARIHRQAEAISFGCFNGITLKCLFWGYRPGTVAPLPPPNPVTSATMGWRYHQSCMGMGEGNYCGNGTSYTRELTPVAIRDNRSNFGSDGLYELTYPETPPGNLDTFYIEGGWDDAGKPICLAQKRWEALGPACGAGAQPPRCDGMSMDELFAAGALIVDGAATNDAPLRRWQKADGTDTVLTVRGFYRPALPGLPELIVPPFPGYTKFLGVHGMLLRTLPGSLPKNLMLPIYMQNFAGGDRYLSDTPGLQGSFEGYAFRFANIKTADVEIQNLPAFGECRWSPTDRDSGVAGFLDGCTPVTPPRSLGFALPSPP